MKKTKIVSVTIIIALLMTLVALPINTSAKTIKQFEDEVAKYTKELQAKKDNLAKNDAEIAQIRSKISSIEKQIASAEEEINSLQDEIEKSNEEIKEKGEESKRIIEYYQISNGDNAYLEYAFGATDITDMIYRLSVVEQLTEYNDNLIKELEELIEKNKAQQKELAQKKVELNSLKANLENERSKIETDSMAIRETMPTIEEQIKAAQANVTYYKKLGCGTNEDIRSCQYRVEQSAGGGSTPSANGFYRPMQYGYITQGYYGYGGHLGMDLSSSDKAIAVYPIATGTVFRIYHDNCKSGDWRNGGNCSYGCNGRALVVKIRHNVGGKYIYSTYAHLRSFGAISEGQIVTPFTIIGYMGSTGCSTGPHLHLEITNCDWNRGGGCTWGEYQQNTINPTRYVNFPSRWNNR